MKLSVCSHLRFVAFLKLIGALSKLKRLIIMDEVCTRMNANASEVLRRSQRARFKYLYLTNKPEILNLLADFSFRAAFSVQRQTRGGRSRSRNSNLEHRQVFYLYFTHFFPTTSKLKVRRNAQRTSVKKPPSKVWLWEPHLQPSEPQNLKIQFFFYSDEGALAMVAFLRRVNKKKILKNGPHNIPYEATSIYLPRSTFIVSSQGMPIFFFSITYPGKMKIRSFSSSTYIVHYSTEAPTLTVRRFPAELFSRFYSHQICRTAFLSNIKLAEPRILRL